MSRKGAFLGLFGRSKNRQNKNLNREETQILAQAYELNRFDAPLVDLFWKWVEKGCSIHDGHKGLEHMAEAVRTLDQSKLTAFISSKHDWIRFAAANNPHCPPYALWGDGSSSWGLAEDSNLWVRAAVVIVMPSPPASVLKAAVATVGMA